MTARCQRSTSASTPTDKAPSASPASAPPQPPPPAMGSTRAKTAHPHPPSRTERTAHAIGTTICRGKCPATSTTIAASAISCLHRSHAASILLFRFHRGNTLSFRSTLDRSHGDCSRSAARPTDRLIFSPRFFFLFSSASAHSSEWMRPVGSHRSCTRSRLTPVEVRLPTAGEFARRPCSPRHLHGSAPFCVFEFSPDA